MVVPMDIDDNSEGSGDDDIGFIYLFINGIVNRYEKRNNQWCNVTGYIDGICRDIGDIKTRAFSLVQDRLARYWNTRIDMRLRLLKHMEESEYEEEFLEEGNENEEEEADRQEIDYDKLRDEYEA